MNVNNYLDRFNATHLKTKSLKHLTELQFLHMTEVPFENLDVIRRKPIYLNLNLIYEKIVHRHRGGYCYELNGLFHWLLNELGYDASLVAATVLRPNGQWAKPDTHAAIIVQLEQPYLVDVGFGDSTVLPIPLNSESQTDSSGTYFTKQSETGYFDLMRSRNGETRPLYRFTTSPKQLVDFHEGCVFNQVSPDSTFTHVDIITKATPAGRITLRDQELTIIENGKKTTKMLSSSEKEEYFVNAFAIEF